MTNSKGPVKVLSLDGGGIRGVVISTILKEIEQMAQKPIYDLFDMYSGTSTGGLLAMGLVAPASDGSPRYSVDELLEFYCYDGSKLFSRSWIYTILSLNGFLAPKYSSSGIDQFLKQKFDDLELKNTLKPVVIVSYDIRRRNVHLFHSEYAKSHPSANFKLRDATRASAAAPTFFAPAHIKNDEGTFFTLVDGGVAANNPALVSWVDAKVQHPDREVLLVSLGTGSCEKPLYYRNYKSLGKLGWADHILEIVTDGSTKITDQNLKELMPVHRNGKASFYRFQPSLTTDHKQMDDIQPENIQDLMTIAKNYVRANEDKFSELVERLLEP